MYIDTALLSRAQFGFTIGFHILFPTLNIGLALFLAVMEGLWLKTRSPVYMDICRFWTKIFALTFGMGVVSGIVLAYELGTNFGAFTQLAGPVIGPLFAYEVLSAFFLEAGFLGVMLFGWEKVGPKLHYCATLMVMIGTAISAFWILSANSWMQTPAGVHMAGGKFVVDSFWQVVFNPSFVPRFLHMVMASYVTSCFVVMGVSAWYLLKGRHDAIAKRCFSFAMMAALLLSFGQILLGDMVGIEVHDNQPLKTAAMEGVWDTQRGAPLILFAVPDAVHETNKYVISIPKGASLINTHQLNGEMIGLKSVPASERPLVVQVFYTFRIMVGIGLFLFGVALLGLLLRLGGKLYTSRWFYRICIFAAPLGFLSTIMGWLTTEFGRQPWIIYQMLSTVDGASKVPLHQVVTSLILFVLVYGLVFIFYLIYLFKVIRTGPSDTHMRADLSADEQPPFTYMTAEQK